MTGSDIRCLNCRCQGESHKATTKPCQDFSYSETAQEYTIAIVSDGHGGSRYYRSDIGSRLLSEVTTRCITEFVKGIPETVFSGQPFTTVGIGDKMPDALRQLFGAIVVGWRKAVMEHADHHALSETEQSIAIPQNEHEWEKTYGCTLIAALRTSSYWLAFQVGDGRCVAIKPDGTPFEPIPWDERCFLNKTTSICDTEALSRFRCCFGGIETAPVAIFLGSDGIDDSLGEEANLYNFYIQLAKGFARDGHDATVADLKQSLPIMSQRGSRDDMSVAGIYDSRLQAMLPLLVQWQIERLEEKRDDLSEKVAQSWATIIKGAFTKADREMTYNDMMRWSKVIKEINLKIKKITIQVS